MDTLPFTKRDRVKFYENLMSMYDIGAFRCIKDARRKRIIRQMEHNGGKKYIFADHEKEEKIALRILKQLNVQANYLGFSDDEFSDDKKAEEEDEEDEWEEEDDEYEEEDDSTIIEDGGLDH